MYKEGWMFMFKGVHMSGVGMFGVGVGWVCGGGYLPTLRHGTWDTMGYGRKASGSHPTGMLSCSKKSRIVVNFFVLFFSEN